MDEDPTNTSPCTCLPPAIGAEEHTKHGFWVGVALVELLIIRMRLLAAKPADWHDEELGLPQVGS